MDEYKKLFMEAPIGIFRTTAQGKPLSLNQSLVQMLGGTNEKDTINYYSNLSKKLYVNPKRRKEFIAQLKQKKQVKNFEYQAKKIDGSYRWFNMDARIREIKADGSFIIEGFVFDITEMKATKQALERKKEVLENFFNLTPDLLCILNSQGEFVEVNQAWGKILGYSREEIEGSNSLTYVHSDDYGKTKQALKQIKEKKELLNFVNRYQTKSGKYKYLEWRARVQGDLIYAASRDITQRKKQEDKIKYISFHDNLTNLYNRTYLEKEFDRLDSEQQLPISLIMADLNGLKIVNDTYGHNRGDQILLEAAEILKTACREGDIIARWGGDEFIIFLPQTGQQAAQKIYERIKKLCAVTNDDEVPISIALGIASKNKISQNLYEVLNTAEEQMYKNKLDESRSTKSHIVKALLKTLGEKSDETEEHAWRMQKLTFLMAEELGLSQAKMDKLSLVATLHDIGKTIIPAEILTKKGKLNDDEWQTIQQHPKTGYRIASSTEEFAHVAEEILYHHERWDGDGYPHGLQGKEIPLLSRIITIVDAYDVMTNGRSYKEGITKQEAIKELKRCSGTQFDPELVDHFIKVMD